MEELKDDNQKMTLAFEQLQRDHDKLKEDEQGKSKKLQEFQLLNEHREQAKQDLKGKRTSINDVPRFLAFFDLKSKFYKKRGATFFLWHHT